MSSSIEPALKYLSDHELDFLTMLKSYVAFPSISTDPDHYVDIQRAAEWVAGKLRDLGIHNVTLYPTARNPVVYGEYLSAGNNAPVVLIYGHYDVQPPDPLDLWTSPPFAAEVRGDRIFGRGIADMKGQLVSCLAALEAIVRTGPLPVNLKFLIEGEEEIGSPNLNQFVPEHKDLLACSFALNLDAGMVSASQPTITYGMRGISVCELSVSGPARDLHSGLFGGVVANPVQVLCRLIAEMQDENGHITLPGFYDRVRALSAEERAELSRTPQTDKAYLLQATGAPRLWGESGYTPVEQTTARPTLDVNGISGGYSGAGTKTIIPANATAKISLRLVPDQDPVEVFEQIRQFIRERAPDTIHWEMKEIVHGAPVITERGSKPVLALAAALRTVWGEQPLFIRMGGSVPVVALFQKHLGVETVNTGFAIFSESRVHSPDENLHLPTWHRGTQALTHFFFNLD